MTATSLTCRSPLSITIVQGDLPDSNISTNTSFACRLLTVPASTKSTSLASDEGGNLQSDTFNDAVERALRKSLSIQLATTFGFVTVLAASSKNLESARSLASTPAS